jgi:hypothetical protein
LGGRVVGGGYMTHVYIIYLNINIQYVGCYVVISFRPTLAEYVYLVL